MITSMFWVSLSKKKCPKATFFFRCIIPSTELFTQSSSLDIEIIVNYAETGYGHKWGGFQEVLTFSSKDIRGWVNVWFFVAHLSLPKRQRWGVYKEISQNSPHMTWKENAISLRKWTTTSDEKQCPTIHSSQLSLTTLHLLTNFSALVELNLR